MAKRPTSNDDAPARQPRIDPLVAALLGHLPPAHTAWPPPERKKWIDLLSDALGVIYKDEEPPPKSGASSVKPTPGAVRTP